MKYFDYIVNFLTILAVAYYTITLLQWHNYKLKRVIFKFHKWQWHILYFILPVATYYVGGKFFWIYLFFGYLPALFIWNKRLDKKLVFTARVKRFFSLLIFLTSLSYIFDYYFHTPHGIILPLIFTIIGSNIIEAILFNGYKRKAKKKLNQINPKVIAITASYGKTSIKSFLYQLISEKYNTYKTPRSVNTLKGIVQDINTNLPICDVYIVEAGAREKGDIKEIAEFVENEYAIIGKIGPQHIEYFKTLENIINTKKEILLSSKLIEAITYDINDEKCISIKNKIKNVKSTLNGIEWDLEYEDKIIHLTAPILGGFNAINLSLSFYMAKELEIETNYLIRKIAKIEPIPHRLQKIEVGGKIIIDDSFNGNIEGMLEAINIVKEYKGKKVIITPGLVEANEELNQKLAKAIDEVFDLVVVTGSLNRHILCENIHKPNKIYLADKSKLEKVLAENTKVGDLILFSNDAPTFI